MKVVSVNKYQGIKVYILQHGTLWQYFFFYKGSLYMQHATATPKWVRKVLHPFGLSLFGSDEDSLENSLMAGAVASIDELKHGTKQKT